MITQVLSGHTSPETAYVVEDYPYGFKLRCSIRYWIETKKGFGQRVMSQTTNPKRGNGWTNKPKAGTYSPIKVLYLDGYGYVQNAGLTAYSTLDEITVFQEAFATALTGLWEQGMLGRFKAVRAKQEARQAAVLFPSPPGN